MSLEESQSLAGSGCGRAFRILRPILMILMGTAAMIFLIFGDDFEARAEEQASSTYTSESLGDVLYFSTENPQKSQQELVADQAVVETQEAQNLAAAGVITDAAGRRLIPAGRFRITGYCPCYICSEGHGTMTSTGSRAVAGRTVAVDPRVIPYGTHLLINGHEYIAEDCGGLIKNKHIDIYFNTHNEARNILFYTDVYIIA